MKLTEAFEKLENLNKQKKDLLVPEKLLKVEGNKIVIGEDIYLPTAHCHSQIAEKLKIPVSYYDKMLNHSDLYQYTLQYWWSRSKENRLLRLYSEDKILRAYLSNRYKTIDNIDVVYAVITAIQNTSLVVREVEITEKRLYIDIVNPQAEVDGSLLLKNHLADRDKGIIPGFTVRNSEVGAGSFELVARAIIKVCNNGLIIKDNNFRRVHLGGRMDEIDYSYETQKANIELIKRQVFDFARKVTSKEFLQQKLEIFKPYANERVNNIIDVTQKFAKVINFPLSNLNNVYKVFYQRGDESLWGVANAFTEVSQIYSPDKKYEIEELVFECLPSLLKLNHQNLN